jgi:hypothetical protein
MSALAALGGSNPRLLLVHSVSLREPMETSSPRLYEYNSVFFPTRHSLLAAFHVGFLLSLLFHSEDRGDRFSPEQNAA